MDELDKIILDTLRSIGCILRSRVVTIKDLQDVDVFHCLATCFNAIAMPRVPTNTNLPDDEIKRFRAATALAVSIKEKMGYKEELGFHTILYPEANEIRKLLLFIIERIPKPLLPDDCQSISESHRFRLDLTPFLKTDGMLDGAPLSSRCKISKHEGITSTSEDDIEELENEFKKKSELFENIQKEIKLCKKIADVFSGNPESSIVRLKEELDRFPAKFARMETEFKAYVDDLKLEYERHYREKENAERSSVADAKSSSVSQSMKLRFQTAESLSRSFCSQRIQEINEVVLRQWTEMKKVLDDVHAIDCECHDLRDKIKQSYETARSTFFFWETKFSAE